MLFRLARFLSPYQTPVVGGRFVQADFDGVNRRSVQ